MEGLITNISGVDDIQDAIHDVGKYDPTDSYTKLTTHAQIGYILSGYINLKGLVSIDIFTPGGAHYHVGDTLNGPGNKPGCPGSDIHRGIGIRSACFYGTGVEDNVNANSTHQ